MKKDKKKTIKEDWLNKTLHSSDSKTLRTTHAILKWLSTGGNWPPRPPRHYHLRVKVINPSAASGHTRADNLSHQLPNVTGEFPSTEHILEKSRRRNKKGSRRWNWSNGGVKNGHSCAINLSRTTVKWGQTWRELIYDRAWMSQPIIVEDPKLFFRRECVFSTLRTSNSPVERLSIVYTYFKISKINTTWDWGGGLGWETGQWSLTLFLDLQLKCIGILTDNISLSLKIIWLILGHIIHFCKLLNGSSTGNYFPLSVGLCS